MFLVNKMKVECPNCKGKGWDGYTTIVFRNCRVGPSIQEYKHKKDCKLCKNTGWVDWLTRITRKDDGKIPF